MDHVSGWTKPGARLLLCQPYHLSATALLDLARAAEHFGLDISIHGCGWYGFGTVAIELTPAARSPKTERPA